MVNINERVELFEDLGITLIAEKSSEEMLTIKKIHEGVEERLGNFTIEDIKRVMLSEREILTKRSEN